MSFKTKVINGTLRYRASKPIENLSVDIGSATSEARTKVPTVGSLFRLNPCSFSLPPLTLPSQLDFAAINYLRENSLSSPKAIEARAASLNNYLWSRSLMSETEVIQKKVEIQDVESCIGESDDTHFLDALHGHNPELITKIRPRALHKLRTSALDEWKSLTYSGHNCELYLTARLTPNFASVCRALYEIRKRCPKFIPRNLFDFGSGLGTVTWAANTVWPVGCINEHYMVEPSATMVQLSEYMLRKDLVIQSAETIFPGICHRRFLPATKKDYDLVVSAHSLLELPGKLSRYRILSNLWQRTTGFLVLVEQGTKAGFEAICEARDWLIENGGDDMRIFAPCPHTLTCGKKDSVCNIAIRYYPFKLTHEKDQPSTELLSYLIISRGDWRIHQTPAVEPEANDLPRLVTFGLNHSTNDLMHDICLPSGDVQRTLFSRKATAKQLSYFLRHAEAGDIFPGECDEHDLTTDQAVPENSTES